MRKKESKIVSSEQLSFTAKRKEGMLWNNLSEKEKEILMNSYEESKNRKNLISHEKVMEKYSKWLIK